MPMARPDPARSEALDPEFVRILRMADPGPALGGPLTFLPPPVCTSVAWLQAWTLWQAQTLTGLIAPILTAVITHAERGEAREIQALDLAFTTTLETTASGRSATAGAALLKRLSTARGERWLDKLQRAAAAGQTPAHFAVVYAAQSVLFHLPLRLVLPGYAYWEWSAAMTARPPASGPLPTFSADAALSTHVFDAAEPFRAASAHVS